MKKVFGLIVLLVWVTIYAAPAEKPVTNKSDKIENIDQNESNSSKKAESKTPNMPIVAPAIKFEGC